MEERVPVVRSLEGKIWEMLTRSASEYPSRDIQLAAGNKSLKLRVESLGETLMKVNAPCPLPLESELLLRRYQLHSFKTHPNLSLPGSPIEVTLGSVDISLAVVAFHAMLLGGLGRTSGRREGV